nr:MAG TPA: hypothetical protein [Caudoviricetes sp.]
MILEICIIKFKIRNEFSRILIYLPFKVYLRIYSDKEYY